MQYREIFKEFNKLTLEELYAILKLRSEIFVVEQNCVFLDLDDKDFLSHHLLFYHENILIAYARLLPGGVAYSETSIGRVVNSPMVRGLGIGKELLLRAIDHSKNLWGYVPIKIGAQLYLKSFYQSFGFKAIGEIYDEDGIEHIEMVRDC